MWVVRIASMSTTLDPVPQTSRRGPSDRDCVDSVLGYRAVEQDLLRLKRAHQAALEVVELSPSGGAAL